MINVIDLQVVVMKFSMMFQPNWVEALDHVTLYTDSPGPVIRNYGEAPM